MKKKLISIFMTIILCFPMMVQAEEDTLKLAEQGKSAILIEASSGKILYEKNAHERMAPASMTKMMSMLLVMEKIDRGELKWSDIVTVSENASGMGGSQILLETGEQMSVEDLFKGVAVASGNDVAVTKKQSLVISEEIII